MTIEEFLIAWHEADERRKADFSAELLWVISGRSDDFTDWLWRLARLGICQPISRYSAWRHPIWTHWKLL